LALLIRSVLLIANPASRRGAQGEPEALRVFRDAGVRCEMVRTERPGHAAEIARERIDGHDAVFTLGGDGTAMEVVGALVGDHRPVGILPGGTGNQLVRHLRSPLGIGAAVRALLVGDVERLDVGRLADGRRFALAAGFGLAARMMEGAPESAKRRFGVGAYMWSSTRALLRNEQLQVRATVDGVAYERVCALAMIANVGALFGGALSMGPGVRADDGLLDLCLFSARSPLEAMDVVRRCALKDFRPHRNMLYARGSEIRLETVPPSLAQADGDLLGDVALVAAAEPFAARLLRPSVRAARIVGNAAKIRLPSGPNVGVRSS
jgi:diacylglycerol kinase family enzyme